MTAATTSAINARTTGTSQYARTSGLEQRVRLRRPLYYTVILFQFSRAVAARLPRADSGAGRLCLSGDVRVGVRPEDEPGDRGGGQQERAGRRDGVRHVVLA